MNDYKNPAVYNDWTGVLGTLVTKETDESIKFNKLLVKEGAWDKLNYQTYQSQCLILLKAIQYNI